jgi:Undecaprenyl-phosphate glucose phosphotransferase
MIRKHQRFFNSILLVLDTLVLMVAYFTAYIVKSGQPSSIMPIKLYLFSLLWIIPLLLVVYFFMDLYTPMRSRMYRKEALMVLRAHLIGMVLIYSIFFLSKAFIYSREMLLQFGVLGLIFVLSERFAVRRGLRFLRKIGYNQKYLLIIGAGKTGANFARKVREHRDFGYSVLGFLDDEKNKDELILYKPVLGKCSILQELLRDKLIDEVVVALPLKEYCKYREIIDICEKEGVRARIIPDYSEFFTGNPKVEDFDGIPLLNIRHIPLDDPLNRFLKRIFDTAIALCAIILTGPLMVFIAIGIKLTSKGPILFKQERIGQNNQPFNMLKFRSMKIADDNTASTVWTTVDDPRKTKFGSFLRKTSLDELPQFINVLFGDMSVVGPRPERPHFVEQFKEEICKYMVKHQVKPGITGWAQVNGLRGDTSIEKRIQCDIYYIENWDLFFDFKIMLLTLVKGLVNENAY